MKYEPVIGLEVHAQLLTRSKIFCSCSTVFGASPNSNTCPVCLGLPGALPVLNGEAVAMAVKAGLALGCQINERSIFARKNYFYPDLPKGYQISQYEVPLAQGGRIEILTEVSAEAGNLQPREKKSFGITRVHLEEDAGKSIHIAGGDSYVDLNRTGVPLIEIVSEPDLRSSQEAYDYLSHLRRIILYLEICDGNMEEGSLRCDANVSIRPEGSSELGTKVEIKNLNSFKFLQRALDYEIVRQVRLMESGAELKQETRLWDEDKQQTTAMRSKEEAHDYRYFPDPDLLPIVVAQHLLEKLATDIPELPQARLERFVREYSLADEDGLFITQTPQFADYFEAAVRVYNQPKSILNWMSGDLVRLLKQYRQTIGEVRTPPEQLAVLVRLIDEGKISGKIAKQVFDRMFESGESPEKIISREGLQQISDEGHLESIVDRVLKDNPGKVQAFRNGKEGLVGFFMGQVMQETRGQANPKLVNEMLRLKLQSS